MRIAAVRQSNHAAPPKSSLRETLQLRSLHLRLDKAFQGQDELKAEGNPGWLKGHLTLGPRRRPASPVAVLSPKPPEKHNMLHRG